MTRERLTLLSFVLIIGAIATAACNNVHLQAWCNGCLYYATSFQDLQGGTMQALKSGDGMHFSVVGNYFDASLADPYSAVVNGSWWLLYSKSYNHLYPAHAFGVAKSVDGGLTYQKQQDLTPVVSNGCFEVSTPKFVTGHDGSIYTEAAGYHVFFECFADQSFSHINFYHVNSYDLVAWSSPADEILTPKLPSSMQNPIGIATTGTFFLWYKNEKTSTIEYAQADSLLGPYTSVKSGDWAGWGTVWDSESLIMTAPHSWTIYLTNPMSYSRSTDDWQTWTEPQRIHPDELRNGSVSIVK